MSFPKLIVGDPKSVCRCGHTAAAHWLQQTECAECGCEWFRKKPEIPRSADPGHGTATSVPETVDQRPPIDETAVLTRVRRWAAVGLCQGYLALNSEGYDVLPECSEAARWCLLGAFQRVAMELGLGEVEERADGSLRIQDSPHPLAPVVFRAWERLRTALSGRRRHRYHVTVWNDRQGRRLATLLAMLDRARGAK